MLQFCYQHLNPDLMVPVEWSIYQVQGRWQQQLGDLGDQHGQFNRPRGLTLTSDESSLLVADSGNHRVQVLRASDGTWLRTLSGPAGTLEEPHGVAVVPSTGEVLVTDIRRNQVVRFKSIDSDTVIDTLGAPGDGPSQFNNPCDLIILDGPYCPLVRSL